LAAEKSSLAPQPGLVVRYSYLWHHEYLQGREEGVKDRPCAIVISLRDDEGDTVVLVAPITHTKPSDPDEAIEIPAATKRRLGLDDDQSWIVVTELNRFVWPGPDLRPAGQEYPGRFSYGFLPAGLFARVKAAIHARAKQRRLRTTSRT
jgi:hypothetical protein